MELRKKMNNTFYNLIYLCGCAVNGTIPSESFISEMDMKQLYAAAKYHTLTSITACTLESAGIQDNKFCTAKEKAIRKNIFLDTERKRLFSFCEENGIWYMPLKGSVLKELYPDFSMRQMADNDILFDTEYRSEIKKYFEDNGYSVISYNQGNHDVYEKLPVLNFEMHTSLFGQAHDNRWKNYYKNIKEKLIKDSNNSYGYHFSDDDFYIYIITHEYKHYSGSGTGIRSLLDCYVYLQAKQDTLNWDYITQECQKLGISDFEKKSRQLSQKVFGKALPTDFEKFCNYLSETETEMLKYYLTSGVYGTLERRIENRVANFQKDSKSKSKFRYILSRIFPGMDTYKSTFPFFYKHKWLLPIGWLYRLIRMIFSKKRRNSAMKEFDVVRKM